MNEIQRIQLRVPSHLKDWLQQTAKDHSRSMNGEIIELMKKAKEKQEKK